MSTAAHVLSECAALVPGGNEKSAVEFLRRMCCASRTHINVTHIGTCFSFIFKVIWLLLPFFFDVQHPCYDYSKVMSGASPTSSSFVWDVVGLGHTAHSTLPFFISDFLLALWRDEKLTLGWCWVPSYVLRILMWLFWFPFFALPPRACYTCY